MPGKQKLLKTKQRGPQVRGLQTRELLIQTAVKGLEAEGVHGLRYAQIAKMAKVPQALMGYHFPTLEDLLLEIIQRELAKLRELSVSLIERYASQPKKALVYYIRAPFDLAATDSSFRVVWSAFYHLAIIHPRFSEINLEIRKTGRERILNLVTMVLATEGRMNNGRTLTRESLIEMATQVQGIITGLAIMAASEANGDYKEFSDLAVEASLKILELE